MAYKIRKSSRITEDLELLGENGEIEKIISVDINVERIATRYRTAVMNVSKLQTELKKKNVPEVAENLGKAIVDMFYMVLGVDATNEILEWYEGKYLDMFDKITPFIMDVIQPAVEDVLKAKKADIAHNHKFSRQQKRRLGLR